jgi:HEAT repeat protein
MKSRKMLAKEVAKFRQWAIMRQSPDYRRKDYSHGDAEWESDYPDWQAIYTAVERLLESAANSKLSGEETEVLLYALARDNEDERILETLQMLPALALQVAHAALTHSDADARWQAAVLLGRIGTPEAVSLLRAFLADDAEYVRRRAGFALEEAEAKPGSTPTRVNSKVTKGRHR